MSSAVSASSRGRSVLVVVLLILLVVGGWKRSQRQGGEEAIRAVLNTQVAAWNRGDIEGFMQGYWNSPEVTFFSGDSVRIGWHDMLKRYQETYQGPGKEMGQLSFSDLRIVQAGDDDAWIRGRWRLQMAKSNPGGLFTLVFRRFPEGWRIVHDHTSAAPPAPATP